MNRTKEPHRRYELEIGIGADTLADMMAGLIEILQSFRGEWDGEDEVQSVSGGPYVSWQVNMKHDVDVTHESYMEAIDSLLDEARS